MPNWCEGTLKLRGKFADLKRFVLEGLRVVNLFGEDVENGYEVKSNDDTELWITNFKFEPYIEGSHRHFVTGLDDIELCADNPDEIKILLLPIKAAWELSSTTLSEISEKYSLDVRIHGYEQGQQFEQDILIIKGQIIHSKKIEHDNWEWECDCPLMGG